MAQRKPQTPSTARRRRIQHKTRRDAGSSRHMTRDTDLLRFGAEQTYVRFDTAGEFLAPSHSLATLEPPPEQLADPTPSAQRAWPQDQRHRMMAVSRLVNKLERRGHVEIIQPWADQPAWFRVTAAGLRYLGLDWPEIPFPESDQIEDRLRHGNGWNSYNHLINQVRMLLARGGADAPTGEWKGERAIEAILPPREKGTRRPHKADGILYLTEPGTWNVRAKDKTVLSTVQMQAGQILGIEVECTQKSDQHLAQILPDLVAYHDYIWYFCLTQTVSEAVARARKTSLETEDQRRRVTHSQVGGVSAMTPRARFWAKEKEHWEEMPMAPFIWMVVLGAVVLCVNPLLPFVAYALQLWASAWNWRDRWASVRALATPGIVFVCCLVALALLDQAQFWIVPLVVNSMQSAWQGHLPGDLSLSPLDLPALVARLVLLLPLAPGLALLYEYIAPRTRTQPRRILLQADMVTPPIAPPPTQKSAPEPSRHQQQRSISHCTARSNSRAHNQQRTPSSK